VRVADSVLVRGGRRHPALGGVSMIYIVKRDGVEIARLTGENLQFAKKMKSSALNETEMIDDTNILKMVDPATGESLLILSIRLHKNLSIEAG
jgi:hypothetical protein